MRTTLNAKVTPAGMDMNADLSMRSGATYYGLKDVHRLTLAQQAALLSAATYPASVYADASGNLYYNNASGNQIAITSGSGLAGTPGSITGVGYGTPISVNWNNGTTRYEFFKGASVYADVDVGGVRLNDGDTNFIRHVAPALAADYTVTWPAAVPASTSLLTMDSAGALVLTRDPSISTLAVSGLVTANGGMTVPTGQNITLQGTSALKHGTRTLIVPGAAFQPNSETADIGRTNGYITANVATTLLYPIELPAGTRINSVEWNLLHDTSVSSRSYSTNSGAKASDTETVIETDSSSAASVAVTVTNTTPFTLSSADRYYLKATLQAADRIRTVVVSYDVP